MKEGRFSSRPEELATLSGDVQAEVDANLPYARALIKDGWKSTSNRYRHIARLPKGILSGLDALKLHAPEEHKRILENAERQAADTYRRMYAERNGDQQTLDTIEWLAFKKAGGESSW